MESPGNPGRFTYLTCGLASVAPSESIESSNNSQHAWVVSDLNSDGKLDLVRNGGNNQLCRNLGDGHGRFHDVACVAAGAGIPGATAADLNGDPYPDVAFTVFQPVGAVAVSLSDGAGGLGAPAYFPLAPGTYPGDVVAADFDRDGKADVAVLTGALQVLRGDGAGALGSPTAYALGDAPKRMAVADFNGDGYADVAVTNGSSVANGPGDLSILLNDGAGTFLPQSRVASDARPVGLVAEDFNGDGNADLAVTHNAFSSTNNVVIFAGDGHGGFVRGSSIPFAGSIQSLQSADLNGDGVRDLIAGGSAHLWVLLGFGDGTFFQSDASYALDADVIVTGDVNNDDREDAIGSGYGGTAVLLGDGAGHLGTATFLSLVPNPTYPQGWTRGDFDRDGKIDLVAQMARLIYTPNPTEVYELQAMLSDGSGGLHPKITTVSEGTSPLAAGDFNGDGKLDVLRAVRTGGSFTHGVNVLLGDGTGGFSPFGAFQDLARAVGAVAAGDVNEDGRADAVISTGPAGDLLLMLGNANGTLSAPAVVWSGEPANNDRSLSLVDVDQDHHLDLVHNELGFAGSPGHLRIWLGDGAGGFVLATTIETVGGEVAVGDVNGDGAPDLVQHDTADDSLNPPASYRVFIGDGIGGFGGPVESPFVGVLHGLMDVDGDGRLDLIAVTSGFNRVALGDGAGRFVAQRDCYTVNNPWLALPLDLNDDGYGDFVQSDIFGHLIEYLGGPGGEFLDYGP